MTQEPYGVWIDGQLSRRFRSYRGTDAPADEGARAYYDHIHYMHSSHLVEIRLEGADGAWITLDRSRPETKAPITAENGGK